MDRLIKMKRSGKFYRRVKSVRSAWKVECPDQVFHETELANQLAENVGAEASIDNSSSSPSPFCPPSPVRSSTLDGLSTTDCPSSLARPCNPFNRFSLEMAEMSYEARLRHWALKTNQSHRAVDWLLDIIRSGPAPENLPRSAKTLLRTSKTATANIKIIPGGKYWYKGIENSLSHVLRDQHGPNSISLNINVDGISVFRSSSTQFWPILVSVHEMPNISPMPVAIFCGNKKPLCTASFLNPLVAELKSMAENGMWLNGNCLSVRVRAFICDSPARAFIKGVANFNAKSGCQKCLAQGEYSQDARTVVFPVTAGRKRTDEDFRMGAYGNHHKSQSPLLQIPGFNMVEDVIVADRLHLVDLGVMKRLLKGWRDGTLGYNTKLTGHQIEEISILLPKTILPSEVHRRQRSLEYVGFWKGSEFSSFLHYSSLAILEDFLPIREFYHFLLFYCAITMFSTKHYQANWPVAKLMLETFVEQFATVYGKRYVTSNIHNLLHVAEEVDKFGPLDVLNTYPFENVMGRLKGTVRHGWKILEQTVNRISEMDAESYEHKVDVVYPHIWNYAGCRQLFINDNFVLNSSRKDSFFLSRDNRILQFVDVKENDNRCVSILGREFRNRTERFNSPISSFKLSIYVTHKTDVSNCSIELSITDIMCKLVALDYRNDQFLFIPLVHTFLD